jgi:predicted AAA+ superfamily ATPase
MVAHPKFYFFDVGIYRSLRPMGPLDMPEEVQGIAFESLFFQELIAINDYYKLGYKIYYWRDSNNIEVDFVLYGERGIRAFEIKKTGKPSALTLKGLKSFLTDYPSAKASLVYGGERRMHENNIEIIPIKEALKSLPLLLA